MPITERNICEVINQIKAIVPQDRPLQLELDELKRSCLYTAPEAQRRRWLELSEILSLDIGDSARSPDPWAKQVALIVAGGENGQSVQPC